MGVGVLYLHHHCSSASHSNHIISPLCWWILHTRPYTDNVFFRTKLGIVFQIRQGVKNGINLIPHFDKTLSYHGFSELNVDAVANLQRLFFRISYGWGHLISLGQSLGGHPRSSFSDLGKLTWVQKGRWDFCRGEINSPTPCCYFPIFYVDC